MFDFEGVKIDWLNHQAAFRLEADNRIIYIDPWDIERGHDADIIFITHAHYDHLSPEDVEKIINDDTVIVAPKDCLTKLKSAGINMKSILPGEKMRVKQVHVEAVPAYNIKPDRLNFHPKENKWVGYILEVMGKKIYHAGDTDKIPEMSKIKCDLAMLPIGGTYTMDGLEGADAANEIKPVAAIPMHWGKVVGTTKDVEIFQKNCRMIVKVMG